MIKITWLNNHNFIKYIAENGKFICAINDEIISGEEGNKIFSRIKNTAKKISLEKKEIEANNEEIIRFLSKRIDTTVDYIDDYRQYKEAVARNSKILSIIAEFKKITGAYCPFTGNWCPQVKYCTPHCNHHPEFDIDDAVEAQSEADFKRAFEF